MALHRNVKVRLLIVVLQMASSCMIVPFMAIYFAHHFGAAIAGLILMVTVFGSVVSSLFGGFFSDKFGRRNILIFGTVLRFLSLILMAIGNLPGNEMSFLAAIALLGINVGAGLQFPPLEAMVIDVTSPETRKKVYTWVYWLNNFAIMIGTFLGAFLHTKYFFILILCTAATNLLILLMVKFFIVETAVLLEKKKQVQSPLKGMVSGYSLIFKDKTFLKFVLAVLMTMGLEKQLGKYISVRLGVDFHPVAVFGHMLHGVEMFGILKIWNAIVIIIFALIMGKLLSRLRISDRTRLYGGLVLFTAGYIVLAVSNQFWFLMLFMLILGLGETMFIPIKNVVLADIAREENRSQYMAANALSMRAASLLSAVWLAVSSILHSTGMAIAYGLMGLTAILMYASIFRDKRKILMEQEDISVNQ